MVTVLKNHENGYYLFGIDMNQLSMAHHGYGVLVGLGGECAVSAPGGGTTLNYSSGSIITSKSYYTLSSGTVALSSLQDVTFPKKVVIYIDADDGTVKAVGGSASAPVPANQTGRYTKVPAPPDYTNSGLAAGDVVLSEIWLKAIGNNIASSDVTDRRSLLESPMDSSGLVTIGSGSTSITVSTPVYQPVTDVMVFPRENLGGRTVYADNISSSSFIINLSTMDSIPHTISWVVDSG